MHVSCVYLILSTRFKFNMMAGRRYGAYRFMYFIRLSRSCSLAFIRSVFRADSNWLTAICYIRMNSSTHQKNANKKPIFSLNRWREENKKKPAWLFLSSDTILIQRQTKFQCVMDFPSFFFLCAVRSGKRILNSVICCLTTFRYIWNLILISFDYVSR